MAKNLFSDYEGFIEKFVPKKTTDDCYTPQWLYDLVLDYVDKHVQSLEGKRVLRPFFPGGDYENEEYLPGDVVVDNPPFSIITPICEFYDRRHIPFFLFAPSLTLGEVAKDSRTAVVCNANVTYENGAQVNTSFVSNMYDGNPAIVVAGDLSKAIEAKDKAKKATPMTPKYDMPDGVLSSARLGKIANAGVNLRIERCEAKFIRALNSMRAAKKTIFGGGWIVSHEAAAREAAAREAAARRVIYWPLSKSEEDLMDSLG